jgi:hypothetical protein
MTDNQRIAKAEELISSVLKNNFNQKLDAQQLREVAKKVARAVKVRTKRAA